MNNTEYYQDQAEHKASPICKECEKKIFPYVEDCTEGFDLEPALKGHHAFRALPACNEFPEECEPDKCSREIIVNAGDLHDWLIKAEKTYRDIKKVYQEAFLDLRFVDLELLIDGMRKKLEEI